MDEQADEYTSDASWYGWLDQWHDDYPQPQDNNKKKCKRSKTKIGVFGIIIVVLLIGVSIAGWGSTLKTSGSNSTAGWGSTSVTPIITTTGVTVQTPKPVTTSADSKPLTCEGFPRIRGDVPLTILPGQSINGFSPHTRGCSVVILL